MNRLVVIVGPTAAGKSRLAMLLARKFKGQIVNADSRQVYRYMDIGTAKPTAQDMAQVRHELVDIINPDQDFSLAQYQELATAAIGAMQGRGDLPILAGGSGLYVWSVVEGWRIPRVAPDLALRRSLEEKAVNGGQEALYAELSQIDPVAAQRIDRRNVRRVIRAIEVCRSSDIPFSELQIKIKPPFDILIIGLTADRTELYKRIDARVDEMVRRGLVAEVKGLLEMGYGLGLPAMSGIGYRQIGMYLQGELTLDKAVEQMKFETHRMARHQYSWFRSKDDRIRWFDTGDQPEDRIDSLVGEFLGG
jgi:tRNA dimethylallyltransferase